MKNTFFLFLLLTPSVLQAETLLLNDTIQFEFPKGWSFNSIRYPIEGTGPYGETLYATVSSLSDLVGMSAEQHAKVISESLMQEAQRNMQSMRKILKEDWPGIRGAVYSSAAQQKMPFGGTEFLVQYLFAFDKTIIYITVEGNGNGLFKAKALDNVMQNAIWK